MLQVTTFTFNPFSENTYIVSDETGDCIIFDPGMYNAYEEQIFSDHVHNAGLKPVFLINTHCHIDHIFGNTYCSEKYRLPLRTHHLEQQVLAIGKSSASLYGLHYNPSVEASIFLEEGSTLKLGNNELRLLFTPGHSPGSLSFYCAKDHFLISGDVLFKNSIGRTDLPGGDYETLIQSIQTQLMTLPKETIVYSGHGPATSVGEEKTKNPFLRV